MDAPAQGTPVIASWPAEMSAAKISVSVFASIYLLTRRKSTLQQECHS